VNGSAIHASALVDPAARLGQGVRIGPWSLVGPNVELGDGTEVGAHVVLEGRVAIGARCRIGHGAIIGTPPQDLKFRPGTPAGVRIGDDTVVREYATIHHATRENADTVIGRRCLLMANVHVAHDCAIGDDVVMVNGSALTGHGVVEDRATIGGMAALHPFGRIGTLAYIGGMAKVNQDVPPFVIADGWPAVARAVNVIGMRRAGLDATARRQAQEAFRILYRSGLSPGAAVERLRAEMGGLPHAARMAEFVAASRLGIVAPSRRRREATEAPSEEPVW
jgi:UDP-N-acetylglucosamine acyltransferase